VLHAAWRIGSRTLHSAPLAAVALAAFVAIFAFDVPFPAIVAAAALAGFFGNRVRPAAFATRAAHAAAAKPHAPALIDDHTPPPAHALFSRSRLLRAVAIGLGLWLAAMAAFVATIGWDATLTQIGWFFSKAALLTFGGAYAVLPYVFQGTVEHYGWLSAGQMMDGLALGETTPGPLIMVVAFVGFVGAWQQQVFGPDAWLAAGIAGACVATFFTFLPSFVFILAGGPFVESTRHVPVLTAPLTAITAAVVGVIVNLALFFAWHVLWPDSAERGLAGFDGVAAAIGAVATVLLFRFRLGVIPLIGLCAAVGLLRGAIG
jgi:chromate transporter